MKKYLSMFLSVIMLFTLLSCSVFATEISSNNLDSTTRGLNILMFENVKVYVSKTNGGTTTYRCLANVDYGTGTTQPNIINIPYSEYVKASSDGYTDWYITYWVNAKDATYMKIHDGKGKTYYTKNFSKPNQEVLAEIHITPGLWSEKLLYLDRTVGFTAYNIQIGGFKVV